MINKLENLKSEIIRLIKLIKDEEWAKADIIILFPPFINKGYNTQPSFWDIIINLTKYHDKRRTYRISLQY